MSIPSPSGTSTYPSGGSPGGRARRVPLLLGCLLMMIPLACGGGSTTPDGVPTPAPIPVSAKLIGVQSCADLDTYLTDAGVDLVVHFWEMAGGYGGGPEPLPVPADDAPALPGADGQEGGREAPTDFTTTNVQEIGVDEPDLVKSDGETIYYVQDGILHVLDAWPAEDAERIAQIDLEGWGGTLFLVGDRLVVLTSVYESGMYMEPGVPMPPTRGGGGGMPDAPPPEGDDGILPPDDMPEKPFVGIHVSLFDVSDAASPELVRSFDVEGSLVGARLVDGIVYLAAQNHPYFQDPKLMADLAALDLPDPWRLTAQQRRDLLPQVRALVRPVIAEYVTREGRQCFLPDLRRADGELVELLECTDVWYPERAGDVAMLAVLGFDPTSEDDPSGVGLIADGWQVYGSANALYVTQDSRWWWWPDNQLRYAETHVHKFALNAGSPAYAASGQVPGWVLDQFSMSEHDGKLRIATTDMSFGVWWWGPVGGGPGVVPPPEPVDGPRPLAAEEPPRDANNVFVLEQRGTDMEMIGAVRGIAPDEQIYAVRFMEDEGYVVTFRQIDPLFVLNLADPTNPRVVGQLELPGFSTYLHPFGEDHLIGIGREGTPEGRVLGLQLQLFDVSDPTKPTRVQQHVLDTSQTGWSWSEAEHDHHAFTFYPSKNLLAIPVTMEDWAWAEDEYHYFSGIIVYEVSAEDGFVEVGRVSHTGLVREVECSPDRRMDPGIDNACDIFAFPWYAHLRRSAFIGDYVYAFSNVGVTASHVDAVDEPVATIPLR